MAQKGTFKKNLMPQNQNTGGVKDTEFGAGSRIKRSGGSPGEDGRSGQRGTIRDGGTAERKSRATRTKGGGY